MMMKAFVFLCPECNSECAYKIIYVGGSRTKCNVLSCKDYRCAMFERSEFGDCDWEPSLTESKCKRKMVYN